MKVFISWSKKYSGEIAIELKTWIEDFFGNKIKLFISKEISSGKTWFRAISQELEDCEVGILILTPENINSPWVMYEAGALSTKKAIIPILFERSVKMVEGPLMERNHITYGKIGFRKLLHDLNEHTNAQMTRANIDTHLDATWVPLSKKLNPIIDKSKYPISDIESQGLKSQGQGLIDLSTERLFSVSYQEFLDTSKEKVFPSPNLFIRDLPKALEKYIQEQVLRKYRFHEKVGGSDDTGTRFVINDTRISNFFSFTDGERLALLDRPNSDPENQMVENENIDVFGAVHFENKSLLGIKIKNQKFYDVKIVEIDEIPGFAFEENISNDLEQETVIMFGYSVLVSPEDLDKITSDDVRSKIYLKHISAPTPIALTAKAKLAFEFSKRRFKKTY